MVPNRVGELENEIALLKLAVSVLRGRLAESQAAVQVLQDVVVFGTSYASFVDAEPGPKTAPLPARALMQRKPSIGLHG